MKTFKNYLIERKNDGPFPFPPEGFGPGDPGWPEGWYWDPYSGRPVPPGFYTINPDRLGPTDFEGKPGDFGDPQGPLPPSIVEPKGPGIRPPGRINIPLRDIVKPNTPSPPPAGLDEVPAPSWWVGTTATWRSYLLWLARTAPEVLAQLLARIAPWFWNEQQAGAVGGHMYKDPKTGHWWYDTGEAGWVEYDQDGRRIPLDISPVKANEPISIE